MMAIFGKILRKVGLNNFNKAMEIASDYSSGNITILYGSQTGNSEFIASETNEYLKRKGLKPFITSMESYSPNKLPNEQVVLFVVSTHGVGEPPLSAKKFYKELNRLESGSLTNLKYAICALGDSSYAQFCMAGKDLEYCLAEKGATAMFHRMNCDVEFRGAAIQWIKNVYATVNGSGIDTSFNYACARFDSRKWFNASVSSKYPLYQIIGDKECWHLSLQINAHDFAYQPGDSIGILPQNDPTLVSHLLQIMGWDGGELIRMDGVQESLLQFFKCRVEITSLSHQLLERYSRYVTGEALKTLLADDDKLKEYLLLNDVVDMLRDFPATLSAETLIGILTPLSPRLYSVSSTQKCFQQGVEIAIRSIKHDYRLRKRFGACSVPLCDTSAVGDGLSVFVRQNSNFHLSEDLSVPIIMIGAGTGLAPFRAFLQERQLTGAYGKNWLIAGDRTQAQGIIYQSEFEGYYREGLLTKLDIVYSRDLKPANHVQDCLHLQGKELMRWLDAGACIYVCGGTLMGASIKSCITTVLKEQKRLNAETSQQYLQNLKRQNRYCEDVY